jgi:hypothetical protein
VALQQQGRTDLPLVDAKSFAAGAISIYLVMGVRVLAAGQRALVQVLSTWCRSYQPGAGLIKGGVEA